MTSAVVLNSMLPVIGLNTNLVGLFSLMAAH